MQPLLYHDEEIDTKAMKAYEFQTKVTSKGKLVVEVPDTFFEELQRMGMHIVRVIALIGEPTDAYYEEQAWACLTAEQFLAGYNDADAIYDLPN